MIKNKKNELDRIKDQISSLEKTLNLKTVKEKESYETLDNYNHQSFLLHRLINNLINQEREKEVEISSTENNIQQLGKDIQSLKENYSKYIVAIYKRGAVNEWASVLDSKSFEQAVLRYKYLEKFSDQRIKDIAELKSKKEELITEKSNLEKEREDKQQLALQKQAEQDNLNQKKIERQRILNSIRHDKAALNNEIAAKRNAEIKIKNLIIKLIENAEKRREEETALRKSKSANKNLAVKELNKKSLNENFKSYDINLSTAGFSSFSAFKGRLNWPVERGRIVKRFGENRNEKLNTVTLNYGIDIKTVADEDVRSVADGVVSAIDWIPGYGSVVIITHKGDYRTVYSHLSNIFVKEGDRVKLGSIIGKVGESLEGNVLHFEIWNQRNKQDPEVWLARK
ncbi:MAG: murein hydrolase activator EnvC family protein [Ignavibacteriaceae bacterium]